MTEQTYSQNKWPAYPNGYPPSFEKTPYLTGRILSGDVATVLNWIAERYHNTVEPIEPAESWGWGYRTIKGTTTVSNHGSGTAMDLNAPAHPQGKRGTFTPEQMKALRAIVDAVDPVVRWGGDYTNTPDEMHWEINVPPGDPRLGELARALTSAPEAVETSPEAEAVGARLEAVESKLEAVGARLEAVESKLEAVESKLGAVVTALRADVSKLDDVVTALAALRADVAKPRSIVVEYTPAEGQDQ